MKILHTADWHLGKRLGRINRLDEQREQLSELTALVENEKIDLLVIAGDIFDTFMPSAEAETLFYDSVVAISRYCPIVVIAGNHDDEDRLCAPDRIARSNGIIFTDGQNTNGLSLVHSSGAKITGSDGMIFVEKGNEKFNLAVLPFPNSAKLLDLAKEQNYSEFIENRLVELSKNFVKGEINAVATHLFTSGSPTCDERELGGSKIVPKTIFDLENCDFVMLGHIHKPVTVSKSKNIYYSGSLLRYSFDDDSEKRVLVYEKTGDEVEVTSLPIKGGKKLVNLVVDNEEDLFSGLAEHENDWVNVVYRSAIPLTAKTMAQMRKIPAFNAIKVEAPRTEQTKSSNKGKSEVELFKIYYAQNRNGKEPSDELVDIFIKALAGQLKKEKL